MPSPTIHEAIRLHPGCAVRTTTGAMPGATRRSTTRPSPTSPRPSDSTPRMRAAYHNRGIAWGEKKEYDKAIADFDEAIRLDPKDAVAYNNRGIAWHDKREYDKAIADYTEAIRLDPEARRRVHATGAIAWYAKEEYDKAIADYTEAIRLDPKRCRRLHQPRRSPGGPRRSTTRPSPTTRGHPARSQGCRCVPQPRAMPGSRRRSTTRPSRTSTRPSDSTRRTPSAYNNRGVAWQPKKEYDKAIADYSEAIRINPSLYPAYEGRAWTWFLKGNYDKAIADQTQALKLLPEDDAETRKRYASQLDRYKNRAHAQ